MKELREIYQLDQAQRAALLRLVKRLWNGTTFAHVIQRFLEGELCFWETSDKRGLVITEVNLHPAGKELFIYGITGASILVKRAAIVEDLKELAALNNCKWIGANACRSGWSMFNAELGFAPVETHYLKEL